MTHAPGIRHSESRAEAGAPQRLMRLLVPSSDVMLAARLEAPARSAGLAMASVSTADELEAALTGADEVLMLLDLTDATFPFAETLATARRLAPRARIIGIFPHVRLELGQAAADAGCDIVTPRSRFFTDIAGSLKQALSGAGLKPATTAGLGARPNGDTR